MNVQSLSEDFTVAGQIRADDVGAIADAGYRVVVCNRPDGEDPGQPDAADIGAACEARGLEFHHLPIRGANLDAGIVETFRGILDNATGPVFAYCRSGQRSAYLWVSARR